MKECIVCLRELPEDSFYTVMKRSSPYTMRRCKQCHQSLNKSWYERNKESSNARSKRWALENPDKTKSIKSNYDTSFYWKIKSELAERAIKLFESATETQRKRFAAWILKSEMSSLAWTKACRVHSLDDWLGAYCE